jgi:hypothetical protein
MGVYPLIEPRQRSVGNVTPHRLLDTSRTFPPAPIREETGLHWERFSTR